MGTVDEEIESRYVTASTEGSDIHQHLPTLRRYGEQCEHITEMGVRSVVSTWAFLVAHPKRLICYDIDRHTNVNELERLAKDVTTFTFHKANVLNVDIEETDLLFIDTLHTYDQLRAELLRHSDKVRKYIILHDTTTFASVGEDGKSFGLWPAVLEFIGDGRWVVLEKHENNNGLTVLARVV